MGGPSLSRFFLGADRGERPWYYNIHTVNTTIITLNFLGPVQECTKSGTDKQDRILTIGSGRILCPYTVDTLSS